MAENQVRPELAKVNHVYANDDETVILGLSVGTIVDLTNCVVTKMLFLDKKGEEFKPVATDGTPINRDFYSVSIFDNAAKAKTFADSKGADKTAQPIASYSLDLLRYSGRVSKTLSYIGKNISGVTKIAIQNSLRRLKKVQCIALPEERTTDGESTRKGSEWEQVGG